MINTIIGFIIGLFIGIGVLALFSANRDDDNNFHGGIV